MRAARSFKDIFLYPRPVDMRKQINGLSIIVEQELGLNPFSEALFIFLNTEGTIIKLLYWDKSGFALWTKRLEKERFPKPPQNQAVLQIEARYLEMLLDGYDIFKVKPHAELSYKKIC